MGTSAPAAPPSTHCSAFVSGAEIPVDGGQSAHGGATSPSDAVRSEP